MRKLGGCVLNLMKRRSGGGRCVWMGRLWWLRRGAGPRFGAIKNAQRLIFLLTLDLSHSPPVTAKFIPLKTKRAVCTYSLVGNRLGLLYLYLKALFYCFFRSLNSKGSFIVRTSVESKKEKRTSVIK